MRMMTAARPAFAGFVAVSALFGTMTSSAAQSAAEAIDFALPVRETHIEEQTYVAAEGDFDSDGFQDIASSTPSGLIVTFGDGTGHFPRRGEPLDGFWCIDVLSADVDADGDVDLVGVGDRTVYVALGDGAGAVAALSSQRIAEQPNERIESADFNGDGLPDILTLSDYNLPLEILVGTGDGTFTSLALPTFAITDNDGPAYDFAVTNGVVVSVE